MAYDLKNQIYYYESEVDLSAKKFGEILSEKKLKNLAIWISKESTIREFNFQEFFDLKLQKEKRDPIWENYGETDFAGLRALSRNFPHEYKAFHNLLLKQILNHPDYDEVDGFLIHIRSEIYPLTKIWHIDSPRTRRTICNLVGEGTEWFHPKDIDMSKIPVWTQPMPYSHLNENLPRMRKSKLQGSLYIRGLNPSIVHRSPAPSNGKILQEDYDLIENFYKEKLLKAKKIGTSFEEGDNYFQEVAKKLNANRPAIQNMDMGPRCLLVVNAPLPA